MCGFLCVFGGSGYSNSLPNLSSFDSALQLMSHRGPDGSGTWYKPEFGIWMGHQRLSVQDLNERANQPFISLDTGNAIVFNGEIYNFKELRKSLLSDGVKFYTESDTEVLLKLYDRHGEAMIKMIEGMFSFVIWNHSTKSIFVVRDPFGIKPLFIAEYKGVFYFASDSRVIEKIFPAQLTQDPAAVVSYYTFGFVIEPFTTWREIETFPCGEILKIDSDGKRARQSFFSVEDLRENDGMVDVIQRPSSSSISAAVQNSLKRHLVSDTPISLFLSAGIDSSVLASALPKESDFHAMTLTFPEFDGTDNDETVVCSALSHKLSLHHNIERIDLSYVDNILEDVVSAMDLPSADGLNTFLISRLAAQRGYKVGLHGAGADELFDGYPFKQFINKLELLINNGGSFTLPMAEHLVRFLKPNSSASWRLKILRNHGLSPGAVYFAIRSVMSEERVKQLLPLDVYREGCERLSLVDRFNGVLRHKGSLVSDIRILDAVVYMRCQLLRDADWAGMANSVEVRVPYVDLTLWKKLNGMLLGDSYVPKRETLGKAFAVELGNDVLNRRKTGFELPYGSLRVSASSESSYNAKPFERYLIGLGRRFFEF
jgi:asparagine synthase (glutamine-hydrolysing)